MRFFANEYRTNWRVARFGKPYVSLIDGAVMGGGVGISIHGSYRVATPKALFAMPECGIGLYPDVGATHVLPRLSGASGMWLGLTGARLGQGDMLGLGLATHTVPDGTLEQVEARLRAVDWRDGPHEAVEAALDSVHEVPAMDTPAIDARHQIHDIFARDSVEAIAAALEAREGDWAGEQREAMARGAPLSLKVTHRALSLGARLDITHALRMEFALTRRFVETGAFMEGVRAQIIDKDRTPRWPHPTLEAVTEAEVASMFEPASDTPDFNWGETS
jgi:enoyl-CoA hydratase/carnithine racemase